jgi:hypothetical protein
MQRVSPDGPPEDASSEAAKRVSCASAHIKEAAREVNRLSNLLIDRVLERENLQERLLAPSISDVPVESTASPVEKMETSVNSDYRISSPTVYSKSGVESYDGLDRLAQAAEDQSLASVNSCTQSSRAGVSAKSSLQIIPGTPDERLGYSKATRSMEELHGSRLDALNVEIPRLNYALKAAINNLCKQ